MAGLGAFNVKDMINAANASSSVSNTNFGVDGGGGVEIKLGRLSAFAEAKIQNVYSREHRCDLTQLDPDGARHFWAVVLVDKSKRRRRRAARVAGETAHPRKPNAAWRRRCPDLSWQCRPAPRK